MIKTKNLYMTAILLFLVSIPAALFLIKPGFYEPSDLHHIGDIYQMLRAIGSGQFPPRLGPDYLWGYGYPLFNFYYVLPFYLGALFFEIFGSLTISFKLVFLTSIFISVFMMYLFLREFFGKFASFVGAFLYLYTPYRAVEIYARGAMGEALALSLLPGVLWLLVKVIKKPGLQIIAGASLMLALFLLSHNYLWLLAAPWIISLVFIIGYMQNRKRKPFLGLSVVAFIAAGISSYWWLPALLEQKLVSSVTPFPLADHFPFLKQLIVPSWGYGASVPGPYDGLSFQIGIVNLVVFVASLVLIIFARKLLDKTKLVISLWAIAGFLITVFMMNIRSYPIWKLLPFYNFVQFPWRLLFLTTLFTSILAAIVVQVIPIKISRIAGIIIIVASIGLTFNYFRPSQIFYKSDNEYLARMFANRTITGTKQVVSQDYVNWSEDYLLLPNWVKEKPDSLPKAKFETENGVISEIKEVTPVKWSASISSEKGTNVIFHSLYFPGWYAGLDGKNVGVGPEGNNGQIELFVPQGKHELVVYWAETPLRKLADFISLGSLGLAALFLVKKRHVKTS